MDRPEVDEVHVSCTFTWDIAEALRLAQEWGRFYPVVKTGGPAFGKPLEAFVPGRYVAKGVTFTTRGCRNSCPWCLVPTHEGDFVELPDFADGYMVQDNNLLQAGREHITRVCEMLDRQKRAAIFSGGIQASLVDDWFADQLRRIRVNSVFLAADTAGALKPLAHAIECLPFLGRKKLRVYTLIGFNGETIPEAEARLEHIWELGALPFAQLYQPSEKRIEYPRDWRDLARTWSRPAAMVASHTEQKPTLPPHGMGA